MKENIIIKIQKLYSQPRNFRVCNKPPALFLKKRFYMSNLSLMCKIFNVRPAILTENSSVITNNTHGPQIHPPKIAVRTHFHA